MSQGVISISQSQTRYPPTQNIEVISSRFQSVPTMIKRQVGDGVEVDFAISNRKIVDDESVPTRQNRWTDLLLTAAEEMYVSICHELTVTDFSVETLGTRHSYASQPSSGSRSTATYSAISTSTPIFVSSLTDVPQISLAWYATATVLGTRAPILGPKLAVRLRCTSDCSLPAARPISKLSQFCGRPTLSASRTAASCR